MTVPPDILAAVKAVKPHDLFAVTGIETYAEQILKAERLQFDSGATLRLTRTDLPYIAICTRKILLRAPEVRSEIDLGAGSAAASGAPGVQGLAGQFGRIGRGGAAGAAGTSGKPGTNGAPGATIKLPLLYIFAEDVHIHPGSSVSWFNLTLSVRGVAGGDGGAGGPGGSGGAGGDGASGVDGPLVCKQQPGDGGSGGAGAPGGSGGPGGNGSAGGSIVFVGPPAALEQLSWARIFSAGGVAGAGGKGGPGGEGGRGGQAGASTMFCHGARPGYGGVRGPNGPDGADGGPGAKGVVICVVKQDLGDVF